MTARWIRLLSACLALAAIALAGVLALRRRWLACAAFAAAAVLARPQGLFLFLPLGAVVVRAWPTLTEAERPRALAAVLAAPAALAALAAYHWRTFGDALAFSTAQSAWGRNFSLDGATRAVYELLDPNTFEVEWLYRDLALCVVYVACLVLARHAGVPASWVVAGALMFLLPLQTGSFTSATRFGLLALPVYCGLAWLGRYRPLDPAIRTTSLVLLVVAASTILLHWP